MAKNLGWVKLHRTLAYNKLWLSEPFTRGQAWVDLLMLAGRDGVVKIAYRKLADRWNWGHHEKVSRFLEFLASEDMIEFLDENGVPVNVPENVPRIVPAFRLKNWAKFQSRVPANVPANVTENVPDSETLLIRSNTRSINTRNIKQEPLKPPKRKSRFLSVNGEMSHELGDTDWMEIDFSKEDENEKDLL